MMIRNLKALGFALAAVFAFSSMAAAGASAQQGYLTADGPMTLDIEELGEPFDGTNALTAFGLSYECPGTTYIGHKVAQTPHELIPSGATEVTASPNYGDECHVSGGRQAEIVTNGCDFEFDLGETTPAENKEHTYGINAEVVCPEAANGILVTVRTNTPPAGGGSDICTLEVTGVTGETPINQDITGAHATDERNGHLWLNGTFNNLHVERTGACVLLGGGTTTNAADFHINATVSGTRGSGSPTHISINGVC